MKRTFPICFVILAFVLALSAQTVQTHNEELRGRPSFQGKVIANLPQKTPVQILGQDGDWLLVQSAEYVGWIFAATVEPRSPATANTPVSPIRPAEAEADRPSGIVVVERREPTKADVVTATAAIADDSLPEATGLCKDGTVTYSKEKKGACSDHGGIADWFADAPEKSSPSPSPSQAPAGGPVKVKGYYRKDGTYVPPYTRSAPRRRP